MPLPLAYFAKRSTFYETRFAELAQRQQMSFRSGEINCFVADHSAMRSFYGSPRPKSPSTWLLVNWPTSHL